MSVCHFWEVLNPTPTFVCGKEPEQGKRNVAAQLRVTPRSLRWFASHKQSCKNCLRVMRARVASLCACGHTHSADSDGGPGPCQDPGCDCMAWRDRRRTP